MQLLIQASPLLNKIKNWRHAFTFSQIQLTTSQKVMLWSLGVMGTSAIVVGVLSRYLARRRTKPILNPRIQRAINKRISRMRSPNGGMGSIASSGGRSSPLGFSERLSLASGSIGSGGGDASQLSPQQLGVMGMEALETSINYWEDALAAFSLGGRGGVSGALALTSPEEAEFCREIQELLQNAYLLQERCELLFLDQRSVLFRSESGGGGGGGAGAGAGSGSAAGGRSRLLSTHTASSQTRRDHHSSAESFASAEDQVADLRDFDDLTEVLPELDNLELYQSALKQLELGIPCRTLRTEVVQCSSDSEFLCKLHCLRHALQLVFRDAAVWQWFVDAGRQVLTDLLLYADKEPKEFLVAYEEMVSWTSDGANWSTIQNELHNKGVKIFTFVILCYSRTWSAPPRPCWPCAQPLALRIVVQGEREVNLSLADTCVSFLTTSGYIFVSLSVRGPGRAALVRAGRGAQPLALRRVQGERSDNSRLVGNKGETTLPSIPGRLHGHFYSISEHLLPVLVWGFLGPRERLRDVCETFQSEIVGFISDLFSFQKSRYTTLEDLAVDILQHAKSRAANITEKLSERN
ncbi:hypothetical protein ACJJTC_012040 [Scirpophaga incertulas]